MILQGKINSSLSKDVCGQNRSYGKRLKLMVKERFGGKR